MSEPTEQPHPYRAGLKVQVEALGEQVLKMLDEGCEMPFDERIVACAAERTTITMAIQLAEGHGRRIEAWLLRRHLKTIVPAARRETP